MSSMKDLFDSIEQNNVIKLKQILENKDLNLNETNEDGHTCVFFAIARNRDECVLELTKDERFDPWKADKNGRMIWDRLWEIKELEQVGVDLLKREDVLKELMDHPTKYNHGSIRWSARFGNVDLVKMFLKDERVDPSADDNYAIIKSAENGHLDVVEFLLKDERVDPSAKDNFAIRMSAGYRHLDVVELLLKDRRVWKKGFKADEKLVEISSTFIQNRIIDVCIGLKGLDLPVLQVLTIIEWVGVLNGFERYLPKYSELWEMAKKIKHRK